MKFLEQTSDLNFALGTWIGNRAKPLFYSVLFNKCHHRTDLIALLFSYFLFKREWRAQKFEISSPKGTFHTNFVSEWENASFIQQISP
jgi:hypothetical protein